MNGRVLLSPGIEKNVDYNVSVLLPPRKVVLQGVDVLIPNSPREYLDTYYGVGRWETPMKCTKVLAGKCVE